MKIAITGNIGAGKSHFGKIFAATTGIPVFDGDFIAKIVMAEHVDEIRMICIRNGNRHLPYEAFLALNFFGNPKLKTEIEAFVQPLYWERVQRLCKNQQIIAIETAILFEKNDEAKVDVIIGVHADYLVRMERLQKRGMSEDEARKRIEHQTLFSEYQDKCTFIIDNSRPTMYQLVEEVKKLKSYGAPPR